MAQDSTTSLSSLLFTRAPLALSRTQRLVSTWLPPPTPEELAQASNPSDAEREQDEIFTPTSELAGLGATNTTEDEKEAMVVRSDEKLRIQLMGKDWKGAKRSGAGKPTLSGAVKPRPVPRKIETELSSEDEAGRTSLGKAKAAIGKVKAVVDDDDTADDTKLSIRAKASRPGSRAKAAHYLDEVLAKKEQKKARKKHVRAL